MHDFQIQIFKNETNKQTKNEQHKQQPVTFYSILYSLCCALNETHLEILSCCSIVLLYFLNLGKYALFPGNETPNPKPDCNNLTVLVGTGGVGTGIFLYFGNT